MHLCQRLKIRLFVRNNVMPPYEVILHFMSHVLPQSAVFVDDIVCAILGVI